MGTILIKAISNKKIKAYVKQCGENFTVKTGKPSDPNCISWSYNNFEEAKKQPNRLYGRKDI
jgi:hypothetical protein